MITTHDNKKLNLVMGGIQNHLLELLPLYEKIEGLKITLLTKYSKYQPSTERVKIQILQKFKNSKISTGYFFLKCFKKFIEINKKEPIDVINIHSYYYDIISPLIMNYLFNIPIFITTPTDFNTGQNEEFISKPQSLIYRIIYYAWMKFFTKIVRRRKSIYIQAINEKILRDLISFKFKKDNLIKIPNGIFSKEYLELEKEEHKGIVYGCLGRLIKSKNVRFLLRVFEKYLVEYSNDELHIFGKGPEESYIMKFISEKKLSRNIKFWGFKDKFEIYPTIDVLIHPSLGEGIPMTLLEANLTETFVIASNVSGNNDIIKHLESGLLFNPYKEEDLLDKLKFFKTHQDLVPNIIENAKNQVLTKFSVENEIEKSLQFLSSKIYGVHTSKIDKIK